MKAFQSIGAIVIGGSLLLVGSAFAAPQAKTYQVTGPVLEVTDTSISVKKGDQTWQIARDAGTKITGELKVGAKVTIDYRMIATDVEVKADKGEKAEAAPKAEKAEKAVKPKTTDKK